MSKKKFLNIAVPDELMQRVDDYRFERRFETRAQAVRFLLEYALQKNPQPEKDGGKDNADG